MIARGNRVDVLISILVALAGVVVFIGLFGGVAATVWILVRRDDPDRDPPGEERLDVPDLEVVSESPPHQRRRAS